MHEGMPIAAQHWDVHGRHVAIIWFGRVTKSEPNIVPGYPGTSCMLWNMAFEYCTEPRARGPRFEYEYLGGFSRSPCDRCGSTLGRVRHKWYYREPGGEDSEGMICTDCLYNIEYGGL